MNYVSKSCYTRRTQKNGRRQKYGDWLRIARKEDSCMLGGGGGPREESDSEWDTGSILHGKPQSHRVSVFAEMLRKTAATRRGSRDRMSLWGGAAGGRWVGPKLLQSPRGL